jgi:PAS domain S-box-containing protein
MEPSGNPMRAYWGIIPLFFLVLILSLHTVLPERPEPGLVFDSRLLILLLNIVFVFISSFAVAYLAGRTYLQNGSVALLLIGAGAFTVGVTFVISSSLIAPGRENLVITVHNCGVLLAGAFHFAATVFALSEVQINDEFRRRVYSSLLCAGAMSCLLLLTLFSQNILPAFFIQGAGFTPLRQMVLGSAAVLFSVAGFNFLGIYHRTRTDFSLWYFLALMLFSIGLLGVFLQREMGDPIGWAGRSAQCLGGAFLFLSVWQAFKTVYSRQASVEAVLSDVFRRPREFYATLVESISDAVVVTDGQERILLWNSAAEKMFGYTVDEVSGMSLLTLIIPPHEVEHLTGVIRSELINSHAEPRKTVEFEAVTKTGELLPSEASISNTSISDQPLCIIVIRNISERKKAEEALRESEASFRSLFETMTEGFALHEIVTDEQGRPADYRFLNVNPAFERLTGLKRADLIGKRVLELLPDTELYWIESYGRVALTGEPVSFENHSAALDRWYEVFAYRPAPRQFAVVFTDISKRKKTEERERLEHRETAFANRVLRAFVEFEGDELFDQALAVVQEETASPHGVFGYIPQPGHLFCPSLSKMLDACEIEGKCIHYPPTKWKGLWAKALTEKRSLYTNEAPPVPPGHPIIHNNLATPILFNGEAIGLLNIANKSGGYTEADRDTLDRIADRIAPVLYAWIQRKLREDERKAAEEERELLLAKVQAEREKLSSLLASIQDEIWFTDTEKHFTIANPAARRQFALHPAEVIEVEKLAAGLEVLRPNGSPRPSEEAPPLRALKGEIIANQEEIVRMPAGGELRYRQVSSAPVRDKEGNIIGAVSVVRDITERKHLEEELRKSRDELDLKVKQRTAELERANAKLKGVNRRLEELNKELQDFAFIASHDLQEPLRKVRSFGDMLAARPGISLDKTSIDYVKRMQSAAARMQDLLGSLLSYSRVTTKAEPRTDIDLKKSVKAALSNLEIMIKDNNARIEVGDLPIVLADQVQMIQLFQNLIGNAVKFHRDAQPPRVKIYAQRRNQNAVEVCVEDDGIGFDEQYLNKIFLPFQRLHGRSSEYKGVGMGLAICKKIVERHGGEITAKSELGKGSTFIVTLPGERKTRS